MIGYFFGPVQGILCGIAYGMLQLAIGPYVVHPAQLLLDYPIAFGMLGLSGFFHKRSDGLIPGYIVGVFGRLVCCPALYSLQSMQRERACPPLHTPWRTIWPIWAVKRC